MPGPCRGHFPDIPDIRERQATAAPTAGLREQAEGRGTPAIPDFREPIPDTAGSPDTVEFPAIAAPQDGAAPPGTAAPLDAAAPRDTAATADIAGPQVPAGHPGVAGLLDKAEFPGSPGRIRGSRDSRGYRAIPGTSPSSQNSTPYRSRRVRSGTPFQS